MKDKVKIKELITKTVASFLEREKDDIFIAIDYSNGCKTITTYDNKTGEDIDYDFELREVDEVSHGIEVEDYIDNLLILLKDDQVITAETLTEKILPMLFPPALSLYKLQFIYTFFFISPPIFIFYIIKLFSIWKV